MTSSRRAGTGAVFAAAVALAATPGGAAAQGREHAEHEVRATVDRIFEGMRHADADAVREVLAPDARFAAVDAGGGAVIVQPMTGWVDALAASEGRWEEWIYDVEVRVDEAMASVWAPYTFYLDGAVRHCGINSIELLRAEAGWKVTQISDTRRTERCPDPRNGAG